MIARHQDELYEDLLDHGIGPLLLSKMSERHSIPSDLVDRVREQAKQEAVYDIEWRRELQVLAAQFHGAGVEALVIKGMAMALLYYEKPGLRPRSDTDLFVAPEEFAHCCEILESQGYAYVPPDAGEQVMTTATYEKSARFELSLVVDLHQAITSTHHPYRDFMTFDYVLQHSGAVGEIPAGFRFPSAELLLLHACFHGAQHFSHLRNRLIWLYDIALLINALNEEQLNSIWHRSVDMELGSVMAFYLLQAKDWFGARLSNEFTEVLRGFPGDESAGFLENDLTKGRIYSLKVNFRNIRGIRAKMVFVLQRLFPPVATVRHPEDGNWLVPIRYIQRMVLAIRMLPGFVISLFKGH